MNNTSIAIAGARYPAPVAEFIEQLYGPGAWAPEHVVVEELRTWSPAQLADSVMAGWGRWFRSGGLRGLKAFQSTECLPLRCETGAAGPGQVADWPSPSLIGICSESSEAGRTLGEALSQALGGSASDGLLSPVKSFTRALVQTRRPPREAATEVLSPLENAMAQTWGHETIHPRLWVGAAIQRNLGQTKLILHDVRTNQEAEAIRARSGVVVHVVSAESKLGLTGSPAFEHEDLVVHGDGADPDGLRTEAYQLAGTLFRGEYEALLASRMGARG